MRTIANTGYAQAFMRDFRCAQQAAKRCDNYRTVMVEPSWADRIRGVAAASKELAKKSITAAEIAENLTDLIQELLSDPMWKLAGVPPPSASHSGTSGILEVLANVAHATAAVGRAGSELDESSISQVLTASAPAAIAGGMVVNLLFTILDGYLTRRAVRLESKQIQATITSEVRTLDKSLRTGIRQLTDSIQYGLARLDARFEWGASEILWRLDQQSAMALEIRDVLLRPLDVQARELRQLGIRSYNYGWFDVAYEYLNEAAAKARTDYIVYHYLGNITLISQRDPKQAIVYYEQAARFSQPESKPHHSFALMHEGLAWYLREDLPRLDRLERAAMCLRRAVAATPENLEAKFQLAQYSSAAGNYATAREELGFVLRGDVRYLLKIWTEADFRPMLSFVREWAERYAGELLSRGRDLLDLHLPFVERIAAGLRIAIGTLPYGENQAGSLRPVEVPAMGKVDISVGDVYYVHDYSRDEALQRYVEDLEHACALLAGLDVFSIDRGYRLLAAIELPRTVSAQVKVALAVQTSWRYFDRVFEVPVEYVGIGTERL